MITSSCRLRRMSTVRSPLTDVAVMRVDGGLRSLCGTQGWHRRDRRRHIAPLHIVALVGTEGAGPMPTGTLADMPFGVPHNADR